MVDGQDDVGRAQDETGQARQAHQPAVALWCRPDHAVQTLWLPFSLAPLLHSAVLFASTARRSAAKNSCRGRRAKNNEAECSHEQQLGAQTGTTRPVSSNRPSKPRVLY
eukprot:scaffold28731_cov61-Phaeocystis_antarctica.AAC.2